MAGSVVVYARDVVGSIVGSFVVERMMVVGVGAAVSDGGILIG